MLAVENLFNTAHYDHLSRLKPYGVFNPGRNVRLQVTIPIGK